jgi:hypothetical protein
MADSKPVKQEVNGTVILPPSVFYDLSDVTNNVGAKLKLWFNKPAFDQKVNSEHETIIQ